MYAILTEDGMDHKVWELLVIRISIDYCSLFVLWTYELGRPRQVTTFALVGDFDCTSMPVSMYAEDFGGIMIILSDLIGIVDLTVADGGCECGSVGKT